MDAKWLKIALLAGVALDFLTPAGGLIRANAQSAPVSGDAYSYQSQDAPAQDTMIVDQLSRQRMSVNADGSINTKPAMSQPSVYATGRCAPASSQSQISILPPSGQYVYITSLGGDWANDSTGSAGAQNVSDVLAGFATGSAQMKWQFNYASTASVSANVFDVSYPFPIKSASPGTAVSLTSPAGAAHVVFCLRATYFFAP